MARGGRKGGGDGPNKVGAGHLGFVGHKHSRGAPAKPIGHSSSVASAGPKPSRPVHSYDQSTNVKK